MKKIHVIATSEQRILTIACQTVMPKILRKNETIQGEWFYKNPDELEEFLNQNPDEIEYFLKGFSYWIKAKWKGFNEHPKRYGKLKRAIKDFSEELFEEIRGLATRIAKQVRKVLKSRKTIYHELRKLKNLQGRIPLYDSLSSILRTW